MSEKIQAVYRPVLVNLPRDTYVEYFGELPNDEGTKFFISRPRENWGYDQFVLHVQIEDGWRMEVCKDVVRYRDGGTTTMTTSLGKFHFPTCFYPIKKPTLDGNEIVVFPRLPDGIS